MEVKKWYLFDGLIHSKKTLNVASCDKRVYQIKEINQADALRSLNVCKKCRKLLLK